VTRNQPRTSTVKAHQFSERQAQLFSAQIGDGSQEIIQRPNPSAAFGAVPDEILIHGGGTEAVRGRYVRVELMELVAR
jgi:hypothetical protein